MNVGGVVVDEAGGGRGGQLSECVLSPKGDGANIRLVVVVACFGLVRPVRLSHPPPAIRLFGHLLPLQLLFEQVAEEDDDEHEDASAEYPGHDYRPICGALLYLT